MSKLAGCNVEVTYAANLESAIILMRDKLATATMGGNILQDPNNTMAYVLARTMLADEPSPFREASHKRRIHKGDGSVSLTGRQIIIDQKPGSDPRALKIIIGQNAHPVEDAAAMIKDRLQAIAADMDMRMLCRNEELYSHHVNRRLDLTFKQLGKTRKTDKKLHRVITWHTDEMIDEEDILALEDQIRTMLTQWKSGQMEKRMRQACRDYLKTMLSKIQKAAKTQKSRGVLIDRPIKARLKTSKRDSNVWHVSCTWTAIGHWGESIDYEVKGEVDLALSGALNVEIPRSEIENKLKRSQNLEKAVMKNGLRISGPTMCMARGKESFAQDLLDFIEDKPHEGWSVLDGKSNGPRLSVNKGLISYDGPLGNQAYINGGSIILHQVLPEVMNSDLIGKNLAVLTEQEEWQDEIIKDVATKHSVTEISLKKREIPVAEALEALRALVPAGTGTPPPQN